MADDNIVDFATRAKRITEKKEQLMEEDPLKAFFEDKDIIDIVVSGLMFIRQTSISETVDIKLDGDEMHIEAKNFVEYDEANSESTTYLMKTASMMLVDEDGEELPSEILVEGFQRMMEAIMKPMDDNDELEKTD